MIRLVIFDLDGTLAEAFSLNLLPHVTDFFKLVSQGECSNRLKIAIATNQGGVGLRYWMEQERFGKPKGYPTEAEIEARLRGLTELLSVDLQISTYVSYSYVDRKGAWGPVPTEREKDPRWQRTWRKPAPGMLIQAMTDTGVTPEETLFIGDSSDDQGAAAAAGCAFSWAQDFFAKDWSDCTELALFERENK